LQDLAEVSARRQGTEIGKPARDSWTSISETETTVSNEAISKLIVESSSLVFRTMLSEEIAVLKNGEPEKIHSCVLAMISLSGPGGGTLSLRCSRETARELAAKLLTTTPNEIKSDADVCDAIGEVANMTAGNLKTQLVAAMPNANLQLSIPTVVTGDDYKVQHLSHGGHVTVPVNVKNAPVVFEFVFNN
jgi:chemotaxis protein CheX